MKSYLIIAALFLSCGLKAQEQSLQFYEFKEIDSLMQQEKRPLAVFLHTDWCRFCKNMEQTTFQNDKVINLLNENFYFISFDAEQEETITFRDYAFSFRKTGKDTGVHSLVEAIATIDGQVSYPSFVLMNVNYEIIFQHNAFLNARQMKKVLKASINNF